MNSAAVGNSLLQVIDAISISAIQNAGFDKTIQATIVSCVDATIGKYKIKYQDGFWYAYSGGALVSYPKGSEVYILIPGGDMSKDKTILGTTKKLGINYISVQSAGDKYTPIGSLLLASSGTYSLCSYKEELKAIYPNSIKINTDTLNLFIKKSPYLRVGFTIKTNFPILQQYSGNYGISFIMNFKDNATGATVSRIYTVDVDNMVGNPYRFFNAVKQLAILDIDCKNFISISKIYLFVKNFPHSKEGKSADIFFSNLSLNGMAALSENEMNGVVVELIAKDGFIFPKAASGRSESQLKAVKRTINAQVRVKMKVVDNDTQNLPYYWFKLNIRINSNSPKYCKYGGQGWECLNSYNEVSNSSGSKVVEYNSAGSSLTLSLYDVSAAAMKYKCVVVYEGSIFSKLFTMKNPNASYTIDIISTNGTEFTYDTGTTDLICRVNGSNNVVSKFSYTWGVVDSGGTFTSLPITTSENTAYTNAYNAYTSFNTQITNGSIYKNGTYSGSTTNAQHLTDLYNAYKTAESVLRIQSHTFNKKTYSSNRVYHADIKSIVGFSTYKCTVYDENASAVVGSANITLVNTLRTSGLYSLIINNGDQVFKYTTNGIAPTSSSIENPLELSALSFTLYDNKGNDITSLVNVSSTKWLVPKYDTMIDAGDEDSTSTDGKTLIYTSSTLPYSIANKYNVNYTNNKILLQVTYHNLVISAFTDFVFSKLGLMGTNGTEYQVRIVPNVKTGVSYTLYPVVRLSTNNTISSSWTRPSSSAAWFKVEMWHNGSMIGSATSAGTSFSTDASETGTVKWSMLTGTYIDGSSRKKESAIFGLNGGQLVVVNTTPLNSQDFTHYTAIVKVEVTFNKLTYYSTLPLIILKQVTSTPYHAYLEPATGFRYAMYKSDGTKPSFDNHNPFTIRVSKNLNNNNTENDVSLASADSFSFTWKMFGNIHHPSYNSSSSYTKNQYMIKPKDTLYDSEELSTGLLVNMSGSSGKLYLFIPIHLYLNRYENAAINGWDGNSVELGDGNGGTILAPQVGAGYKNGSQQFTGIVMGIENTSESNKAVTNTGLFGYHNGQKSIFLNAQTGAATFGKTSQSQIIIDPSQGNKAILKSGNYTKKTSTTEGAGLEINLTAPTITYGNLCFMVSNLGHITAKGGGSIAGWKINDNSIISNNDNVKLFSYDVAKTTDTTTSNKMSINGVSKSNWRIVAKSGANLGFGVDDEGNLYAGQGFIGSGNKKIIIKPNADIENSAIYSYSKENINDTSNGFYLGTDGLGIGSRTSLKILDPDNSEKVKTIYVSNFQVDKDGTFYARKGYIGAYPGNKDDNVESRWCIYQNGEATAAAIYNRKKTIEAGTEGVYLGTDGIGLGYDFSSKITPFYVKSNGLLHSTKGKIANWNISTDSIYTDENGGNYEAKKGMYFGASGISIGENFHVNSDGDLWAARNAEIQGEIKATSGWIGSEENGWKIDGSGFKYEHENGASAILKPNKFELTNSDGDTIISATSEKFQAGDGIISATSNKFDVANGVFTITTGGTCDLTLKQIITDSDDDKKETTILSIKKNKQATLTLGKHLKLYGNGNIEGKNWNVKDGKATFKNVNISGTSSSIGGGTNLANGNGGVTVGGTPIDTHIRNLCVDKIEAAFGKLIFALSHSASITTLLSTTTDTQNLKVRNGLNGIRLGGEGSEVTLQSALATQVKDITIADASISLVTSDKIYDFVTTLFTNKIGGSISLDNSTKAPYGSTIYNYIDARRGGSISETETLKSVTGATIFTTLKNYSKTDHSHAWKDITNKPDSFTPAAHTHSGKPGKIAVEKDKNGNLYIDQSKISVG